MICTTHVLQTSTYEVSYADLPTGNNNTGSSYSKGMNRKHEFMAYNLSWLSWRSLGHLQQDTQRCLVQGRGPEVDRLRFASLYWHGRFRDIIWTHNWSSSTMTVRVNNEFRNRAIRSHWRFVTGQKGMKTAWHLCSDSVYRAFGRFLLRLTDKQTKNLLTF